MTLWGFMSSPFCRIFSMGRTALVHDARLRGSREAPPMLFINEQFLTGISLSGSDSAELYSSKMNLETNPASAVKNRAVSSRPGLGGLIAIVLRRFLGHLIRPLDSQRFDPRLWQSRRNS
jgi:hypothetical protein